jgi:hypothetical protein
VHVHVAVRREDDVVELELERRLVRPRKSGFGFGHTLADLLEPGSSTVPAVRRKTEPASDSA